MEEETESCGDGDECLLNLLSDYVSNGSFDAGTDIGVVVLSELCRGRMRE